MAVLDVSQFNQLVQQVKEALLAGSQGVSEVEVVTSLANLVSLPALRLIGATETVVEAPIELLAAPAVEAAANAIEATDRAVVAAVNAEAAADLADAESRDLAALKEAISLVGVVASEKGDKALLGAMNAEEATVQAMQSIALIQEKLEQAQVIILDGAKNQDLLRELNLQVADSITICAETREDANEAILALRELQTQVAVAIRDAYDSLDIMQLAAKDAKIATALANLASERIAKLEELIQTTIDQSKTQTTAAGVVIRRVEELEQEVLQTKVATDLAGRHAEEQAKAAFDAALITEQITQDAELVIAQVKAVGDKAEKASADAIGSAAGADSAAGHAIEQAEVARVAAERSNTLSDNPPKIIDGVWHKYDEVTKEYVSTGLQAKGDTGSSFKVVGNYLTLESLKAAVPDGTDVDGVYGIGSDPPYTYYAWTFIAGVWDWHSQGKLQGQRGESAYDAAVRMQGYEGTEKEYVTNPVINAELANRSAVKAGEDVKGFITAAGKTIIEAVDRSNALSDNPQRIINGVWHRYDESAEEYVTTGIRAVPIDWRVRDLDHVPTEADVAYRDEATGLDAAYPIGSEVRVFDAEYEEYEFYKLYCIKDDKAVWSTIGGVSLPVDVILCSPSSLSDDELIYLDNGILKNE